MAENPIKLFAGRAERYPEAEDADVVHGIARVALSAIPGLGGPATELLSIVVTPSLAHRRDEWFKEFAEDFDRLQANVDGFKVENLVNNEAFVSAVLQATRIAIATHQPDKRAMLRNALMKSAVGKGPREELQEVFIAAIDTFSLSHIKILNFIWRGVTELNNAGKWDPIHPYALSNYMTAITELYPDLKGQDDFLLYVMTDLKSRGFSTVSRPADSFPQNPGVTNMGVEFLQFILVPPI